jgi:hypothetical protein
MAFDLGNVTIFCFAASYAAALGLEAANLFRPARTTRILMYGFTAAGISAHTIYLALHRLPLLPAGSSSLLFLSWILALFCFYGSLHHRRAAWGVFVLPVVLGLIVLAWGAPARTDSTFLDAAVPGIRFWVGLHVGLLIAGGVGLSVSFVSSAMYLMQSWKLRHKVPPDRGLQLLSLERLEEMSRRGVIWSFPLLTGGLLIGMGLLLSTEQLPWYDPKVLSTAALWLTLVLVLALRYGMQVGGRRLAWLTLAAFAVMLLAFGIQLVAPSSHPFGGPSAEGLP